MTDEEFNDRCRELIMANTEVKEQAKVMMEALSIYHERDALRGDLWRKAGIEDNAFHLKSKAMRIMAMLNSGLQKKPGLWDEAVDEGLDAINYAVFYVRHLKGT